MSFTLLQKGQLRHWQRGQWLPALFSLQNVAQLSTLWSPGKLELHAALVAMGAAPAPRAAIELYRMTAAQQADVARSWRYYTWRRSLRARCRFTVRGGDWLFDIKNREPPSDILPPAKTPILVRFLWWALG